jgi:hypothetical protein
MGKTGYCDYCGTEQAIVVTVSWQENVCEECGNPISDDGSSPS